MNNKINILDNNTINKISAGEVIERPSSIVKELIENSIDANSNNIDIEIKEGGKTYIRVTDDGDGINKDDVQLVFLRHSTSKINSSDDLNSIWSLGFRGEALASIAAVSMVELITKADKEKAGKMIEINGGVLERETEVGARKGTTIIVKNIFYNTPVRRKFLKSTSSETANISNMINKLALSNPKISFNYIKDNKQILKTPGNNSVKSTIFSIYGKKHIESLIPIDFKSEKFSLKGYISKPSYTRGNRNNELIFINGRYINSNSLSKAIEEAYKSLIIINRYPVTYLYIKINPENIDINIHPSKIEVRFDNNLDIESTIQKKITKKLLEKNLIPEINLNNNTSEKLIKKEKQENIIDNLENLYKDKKINDRIYVNSNEEKMNIVSENINKNKTEEETQVLKEKNKCNKKIPNIDIIGRIFDTYIIGEDKVNNIMYMIDQHAAHERVLYEKFKNQYHKELIVTQALLSPRSIVLSPYEHGLVLENLLLFKKLGFDISNFGHNTILLRGVPMIFGLPDNNDLFIDILDKISDNPKTNYKLRAERIIKLACTNAIKAGDFLDNIEIDNLINDLNKCENPFTCPHGRPITINITRYEVEKMFKRIQ